MNRFNTFTDMICNLDNNLTEGIRFIKKSEEDTFISYRNLYKKALYVLHNLQNNGLNKNNELLFQIRDDSLEEYICIFWACILGRIIPVPVSIAGNDNMNKVFNVWDKLSEAKIVADEKTIESLNQFACKNGLEERFNEIRENTLFLSNMMVEEQEGKIVPSSPDDIALVQFSSGSTGDPKGVVLTHRNLITNASDIIDRLGLTKKDSQLNWMPLTHDMGLIGFHLIPFVAGINQYHIPTSLFIRNPLLWMESVNRSRATLIASPNFGFKFFLMHLKEKEFDWDLSCVRLLMNGAEPISVDIFMSFLDRMKRYGLSSNSMFPVYGLAEACVAVSIPTAENSCKYIYVDRDSLSTGKKVVELDASENCKGVKLAVEGNCLRSCNLRIVDGNDSVLEDGVVGNIQICGKNVTSGYYNYKEATDKAVRENGWVATGDLGFIRNNEIVITGRYKDIIFVNGCNYYPHDIERTCEKMEGIDIGKDVALGLYDERLQKEVILVFIMYKKKVQDFTSIVSGIKRIVRENIGIEIDYVIPVRSIPKTTSGKVQRYKLAQMYKDGQFEEVISVIEDCLKEESKKREIVNPKNDIEQDLADICKEVFNLEILGVEDNFKDLGGDSLRINKIYSKIEELYPGTIQISDLFAYPTISNLANYIRERGSSLQKLQIIKFSIQGDLFSKIKLIADNEKLALRDILLGLYAYAMIDITARELIRIGVYDSNSKCICPIELDFSCITQVDQLFKEVMQKLDTNANHVCPIEDTAEKNRLKDTLDGLFVYRENVDKGIETLTSEFKMVFIMCSCRDSIECTCTYDKSLNFTNVKDMVDGYLEQIKSLTIMAN
jgi:acyl-CoA synthetase (AMP-forming)/AMP-acid ligase II/acyl carrier protein